MTFSPATLNVSQTVKLRFPFGFHLSLQETNLPLVSCLCAQFSLTLQPERCPCVAFGFLFDLYNTLTIWILA